MQTWTSEELWSWKFVQPGVLIPLLLILFLWVHWFVISSEERKGLKLPPGPRPWPIVGNLPLFAGCSTHRRMMELNKKYGPLLYLRLGSRPTVVTNSPAIVREFLKHQDHVFCSRPPSSARDIMVYGGAGFALSEYGPHWRHLRKICIQELLAPSRLQRFHKDRHEEAQILVAQVLEIASKQAGQEVELRELLTTFTMNIATRMMMSKKYFSASAADVQGSVQEAAAFKDYLHVAFKLLGVFNVGDYIPFLKPFDLQGYERQMRKAMRKARTFLDVIMREHYEAALKARSCRTTSSGGGSSAAAVDADILQSAHDFVDVLLALPGENGAERLSNDTIEALILELVAVATETSSVPMEWTLAEMVRNPQMQKKIQEEISKVCGKDENGIESVVQESHLNELTYLKAVFKETLRFHPGGAFIVPHMSREPTKVAGYDIPKNTTVLINALDMGRNPESFDKPEEFLPERWLDTGNVDPLRIDPEMRSVPFGGGRRVCPGASLGQCIVTLGLARLLQAFDWQLPEGKDDIDMKEEAFGLTMSLVTPLKARATPRLPPQFYNP
jgi:cytochrome P450